MRICANLSLLFTELPLLQRIAAAAEAGFDGVEIQFPYDVPPQSLLAALQAASMPLVLCNVPAADLMAGGPGLAGVPGREKRFLSALEQAAAYAEMVRPERMNVLAGRAVAGVHREASLACLVDNLRRAAQLFASVSIKVTVEAINLHDMPGFLVNTPEDLQSILEWAGHDNLSAQLDLYHLQRMGCALPEAIIRLSERIGHVQFADCPGRGAPGTGSINFYKALQALKQIGYQGWLGAEYLPAGSTADSLSWLADWRAGWAQG